MAYANREKMDSWLNIPLTLLAWTLLAVLTVLFSVLGGLLLLLPTLLFDFQKRRLFHLVGRMWGGTLIFLNPTWKLRVQGRENIPSQGPFVVAGNHQSLLDILIALAGLPLQFKFLAKRELFSLPFIGWHMTLAGYIPIERGSAESGRQSIVTAREWLGKGVSVLFFPEGTRSLDGKIHEFKMGAFKIAAEMKIPILPVVIDGTGDAIPKKSRLFKAAPSFSLSILKSVTPKPDESLETLKNRVRQQMIRRLEEIRSQSR